MLLFRDRFCQSKFLPPGSTELQKMVCKTYLRRNQAGPSRRAKEQQEGISPNHVQAIFFGLCTRRARVGSHEENEIDGGRERGNQFYSMFAAAALHQSVTSVPPIPISAALPSLSQSGSLAHTLKGLVNLLPTIHLSAAECEKSSFGVRLMCSAEDEMDSMKS